MFNPCCCTVADCWIYQDDFNRADDTDLGADWTEVDGSWAIEDNTLTTASSNAYVEVDGTVWDDAFYNPYFVGGESLSVLIKAGDGDVAGLSCTSTNPSSIDCEITFGTPATCSLYFSGTLVAECEVTAPANQWVKLRINLISSELDTSDSSLDDPVGVASGDHCLIEIDDVPVFNRRRIDANAQYTSVGPYTGTVSGDVYFDDFTLKENQYFDDIQPEHDDCRVTCPWCVWPAAYPADMPASVCVVLEGVTYAGGGGRDPSDVNGSWVLDHVSGTCYYRHDFDPVIELTGTPGETTYTHMVFGYYENESNFYDKTVMFVRIYSGGTSPQPDKDWVFRISDGAYWRDESCGDTLGPSDIEFGTSAHIEGATATVIIGDCPPDGFALPEALAFIALGNGFEFVAAGNEEFADVLSLT